MRPIQIAVVLSCLLPLPAAAQELAASAGDAPVSVAQPGAEDAGPGPFPAGDHDPAEFLWRNRLVAVFADTPRDPAYIRQMELLEARLDPLAERDTVVLTDTDPAARSPLRQKLRPRGFALVLVDKDGRVIQRKPSPWDVREISRTIDSTPLRQQELREERGAAQDRRMPQ